jgi:hypothetical protein
VVTSRPRDSRDSEAASGAALSPSRSSRGRNRPGGGARRLAATCPTVPRVCRSRRSVLSGGLRRATDGQFHLINRAHACDARHRAPCNTRVGRSCRCTRITRGRNRMPPVEFYCGTLALSVPRSLSREEQRERERGRLVDDAFGPLARNSICALPQEGADTRATQEDPSADVSRT